MTAAEKAFETAERMIERARETGAARLDFDDPKTHALEQIPDSIASLTSLRFLDLANTSVSDLAPLTGLTALTTLALSNTSVSDLTLLTGLTKLVQSPGLFGLQFKNCTAAQNDPRIAEIAEIADKAERAQTLFEYLEGWVPPGDVTDKLDPLSNAPKVPRRQIAPLQTDFADGRMIRIAPERLPEHDALTRAKMGWEALKLYRDNFGNSFVVHNYAPLPSYLDAFDTAMGDAFDPKRMIMMGVMGSRIVGLAGDYAFLQNLPVGADTDLRGFAAHIATYLNRFPDWVEYNSEAEQSNVLADDTKAEAAAFETFADALANIEQVDTEVADEFSAEVSAATGEFGDDALAESATASARELLREVSEKALEGVKSGRVVRTSVDGMDAIADVEFAKLKLWSYGWTLVLLKRQQTPLRRLVTRFPAKLGWLGPVLDYLVGPSD